MKIESNDPTIPEFKKALADTLKDVLVRYEEKIVELRKKEILATEDRCAICDKIDKPGECVCLEKSDYEALLNVSSDTFEKLSKVMPPGVSKQSMRQLEDEYGNDKAGRAKAYATAWKIHHKAKLKKVGDMGLMSSNMNNTDPNSGSMAMGEKVCKGCDKAHKGEACEVKKDEKGVSNGGGCKSCNVIRSAAQTGSLTTMGLWGQPTKEGVKCKTCGKIAVPSIKKDEFSDTAKHYAAKAALECVKCPHCAHERSEHLGKLGGKSHFICKGCGMGHSRDLAPANPLNKDKDSKKSEDWINTNAPNDTKTRLINKGKIGKLPSDQKIKEVDVPGSGGEIKKAMEHFPSLKGFKSVASNPLAMPKHQAAGDISEVNRQLSNFQSLASNPTAMPQFPGKHNLGNDKAGAASPAPKKPIMKASEFIDKVKKYERK